jgi:putrescine importer
VLLIGAVCLAGALAFSRGGRDPDAAYQLGAELLNFGALLAFTGVNLASILRGWRQGAAREWPAMLASAAGAATCAFLWWNLGTLARIAGSCWALAGVLLWLFRRGMTHLPGETA